MLSLPRAYGQPLIGELKSCKPLGMGPSPKNEGDSAPTHSPHIKQSSLTEVWPCHSPVSPPKSTPAPPSHPGRHEAPVMGPWALSSIFPCLLPLIRDPATPDCLALLTSTSCSSLPSPPLLLPTPSYILGFPGGPLVLSGSCLLESPFWFSWAELGAPSPMFLVGTSITAQTKLYPNCSGDCFTPAWGILERKGQHWVLHISVNSAWAQCQAHSRWSVMVEWKDWGMDDRELTEHQFALAMLHGLWDLNVPTRDWTWAMAVRAWNPSHWTSRKFLCSATLTDDPVCLGLGWTSWNRYSFHFPQPLFFSESPLSLSQASSVPISFPCFYAWPLLP